MKRFYRQSSIIIINAITILLVIFSSLGIRHAFAAPADDFVTTWKTDNSGTSNATTITVPMVGGPFDVDWDNDMTFDELGLTGTVTHDYGISGIVTIRIQGSYDSISIDDTGDILKILSIDQWGTQSWASMSFAFSGATNLQVLATDTPDFSTVTDMRYMFADASVNGQVK